MKSFNNQGSEIDKRDLARVFRNRLLELMERQGENAARFAARTGIDRSAMSQFLDTTSNRMPRPETLVSISAIEGVSIDWLLGLSQHQTMMGEMASLSGVETAHDDIEDSLLAKWRQDAIGSKIRYVPSSLPDPLRTNAVTEFEFRRSHSEMISTKTEQARSQLDYTRRPESDMEIVMPFSRLEQLASGAGYWQHLPRGARTAQLEFMAHTLAELYPTLRLYLYDDHTDYSVPFTVFGTKRAAIYLGEMYLVLNSVGLIRELTQRFDNLIRIATVTADRAPDYIRGLQIK